MRRAFRRNASKSTASGDILLTPPMIESDHLDEGTRTSHYDRSSDRWGMRRPYGGRRAYQAWQRREEAIDMPVRRRYPDMFAAMFV